MKMVSYCCGLLYLLLFNNQVVMAEDEQSIYLGYHVLSPKQSHAEAIVKRIHSIPLDCDNQCKLTWEVLGDNGLTFLTERNDTIYMSSGIDGLTYEVTLKKNLFESGGAQITFDVSLLKNKNVYIDGRKHLTSPLLRWRVKDLTDSDLRDIAAGSFRLEADIGVGGCQISNDSLGFHLDSISIYELLKAKIGEPYLAGSAKQTMDVACSPSIVNNVNISFTGSHEVITPHVISSNDKVGFILVEGLNNAILNWNGTANQFKVPSDGFLSIPLTAYYARLSNDINSGRVDAVGQFNITYN